MVGPNGCGKTTLIRHLNALLLPSCGEVLVDEFNTCEARDRLEIRRRVGMIFQNPDNQIVGMSVEEDVAFGPGNLNLPTEEVRRRVEKALLQVGLGGLENRAPYTLSGGQKQLLAMAGLLAMEPRFIVLDEPTSSLDPAANEQMLALLRRLNNGGIGIVHVTQNMEEAARADRVVVMEQGRIIADGSPIDILSRVKWLKSMGLAPPLLAELMWLLRQAGEEVDIGVFSLVEAVQQIQGLRKVCRSAIPQRSGEAETDV